MKHFEDFWNAAEELGKHIQEGDNFIEDINKIRACLDKLESSITLEARNNLIADMIFSLCQITRKAGKDFSVEINSAALLNQKVEELKANLLDPEEDHA